MNIKDTLTERASTHGSFLVNSFLSQSLKGVVHNSPNGHLLPSDQKEALDMIMHKVSRILAGDNYYIDTWRDIVGYAQLVVDNLYTNPAATDCEVVKKKIQIDLPF